ncbi:MAG: hypothetical protein J3Q66DRAFT_345136, partial [Benniella sp.]
SSVTLIVFTASLYSALFPLHYVPGRPCGYLNLPFARYIHHSEPSFTTARTRRKTDPSGGKALLMWREARAVCSRYPIAF